MSPDQIRYRCLKARIPVPLQRTYQNEGGQAARRNEMQGTIDCVPDRFPRAWIWLATGCRARPIAFCDRPTVNSSMNACAVLLIHARIH